MTGDLTELFNESDGPSGPQDTDKITWDELKRRGMSKSLINTLKKASALITLKETLSEIDNK